jgi:hypothetical protein
LPSLCNGEIGIKPIAVEIDTEYRLTRKLWSHNRTALHLMTERQLQLRALYVAEQRNNSVLVYGEQREC